MWGPSTEKFGRPKKSKFGPDFGQFSNLIPNVSGTKQVVVEWKTALQTAVSPARACLIQSTSVHKRHKIGREFRVTQHARIVWVVIHNSYVVVKVHRVKLNTPSILVIVCLL